jgi:hypothetical protein
LRLACEPCAFSGCNAVLALRAMLACKSQCAVTRCQGAPRYILAASDSPLRGYRRRLRTTSRRSSAAARTRRQTSRWPSMRRSCATSTRRAARHRCLSPRGFGTVVVLVSMVSLAFLDPHLLSYNFSYLSVSCWCKLPGGSSYCVAADGPHPDDIQASSPVHEAVQVESGTGSSTQRAVLRAELATPAHS